MSKPKIVRVVTAAYVVPWHLGNTLRRLTRDFDVTVVGQNVSANKDSFPDVKWVDIDLERKISVLTDVYSLWALCRFFMAYRPDIVHSIMPKAGLISAVAAFLCRVPIRLHTFTGQIWLHKKPPARYFLYGLDRVINALNTACLTDSHSQSRFLHSHGISYRGRPLPVLGAGSLSGVDVSRFERPQHDGANEVELRVRLGLDEAKFVYAYIARKSLDKGAIDILSAFATVTATRPHARLLFIGPDESAGELVALRATTPDMFRNVIDIGRVNNHELYLHLTHVLCLPSYREGFGSIVIDAAAAGVPTIGSNIDGLVDSIEDGRTGVLIPAGNIDSLARAMLSMIEDPARCKEMGVAARLRVETHFTADALYTLLKDYYFSWLATRNPQ